MFSIIIFFHYYHSNSDSDILLFSGPRYVVNIGEKVVDYNTKFKLFLVSKYSEVELPPSFYAVVSTVNFSTTKAGLTGQVIKQFNLYFFIFPLIVQFLIK